MSDAPPRPPRTPEEEHAAALDEARTLLAGGLIAELITETNGVAVAVEKVAVELAADREARADENRSLHRRNGVQAVALFLSILIVAAIVGIGLTRLTDIATENRATGRSVAECNTPSPPAGAALDAADVVHECYEAAIIRDATNRAAIAADFLDAAFCVAELGFTDEDAVRACYRARVDARQPQETAP